MQRIIIGIIVLIAASFLVSYLFNDFHIELKRVGGELIRMVGITLLAYILLRSVKKNRN